MNWNDPNIITPDIAGECYTTQSLENLFRRLGEEGYTALGLGLIIDLVRQQTERAD